jgi:hypothetical protein
LRFITEHQPGALVHGEVIEFASHGAYAQVESARCYVPLKQMGEPAPRSARDVLNLGEVLQFVVVEYDPPRRGVVLRPTGIGAPGPESRPSGSPGQPTDVPAGGSTHEPAEEALVATKKKAPAKKAVKKAAHKKKAAAKKAPVKKAAHKKKAAAKKKAPVKKAAVKRAAVKKGAPKKKAAARKAVKKSPIKKAAHKKKAAAKKAPVKKAAVKKKAVKKAPIKKAAARRR